MYLETETKNDGIQESTCQPHASIHVKAFDELSYVIFIHEHVKNFGKLKTLIFS